MHNNSAGDIGQVQIEAILIEIQVAGGRHVAENQIAREYEYCNSSAKYCHVQVAGVWPHMHRGCMDITGSDREHALCK